MNDSRPFVRRDFPVPFFSFDISYPYVLNGSITASFQFSQEETFGQDQVRDQAAQAEFETADEEPAHPLLGEDRHQGSTFHPGKQGRRGGGESPLEGIFRHFPARLEGRPAQEKRPPESGQAFQGDPQGGSGRQVIPSDVRGPPSPAESEVSPMTTPRMRAYFRERAPGSRRGPLGYARDLASARCRSARRNLLLAPQAASSTHPHRLGSLVIVTLASWRTSAARHFVWAEKQGRSRHPLSVSPPPLCNCDPFPL